jgi:uncharacterized protein (TIGR00251 family)
LIKFQEKDDAAFFGVRVVPRASKSEIVGEIDGLMKIRLCSPPVDGAANTELTKLLSRMLGISLSDIAIVSGRTSKTKRIRIAGITADNLKDRLNKM